MKKNLFMMAAAALVMTACTSDDLKVTDQQVTNAEPVGIAFDTYVSNVTSGATRAENSYQGYGPYTNTNMKDADEGFGVFASYYSGTTKYEALGNDTPASNFMYNQNVTFDGTAWSYSPLLYWPNQTSKEGATDGQTDSQTGNTAQTDILDRVSFFAYAPYLPIVNDKTNGLDKEDGKVYGEYDEDNDAAVQKTVGVTEMISNTAAKVPEIKYVMGTEPKVCEDLLWAVAPYGGLNYTAVNGTPVKIDYGTSYVDLIKPAANTKIKFLFQHALSALKMSIVAAIDQVAPDGKTLDDNTHIYVNYVELTSETSGTGFATSGTLSLLNGAVANLPNWGDTTSEPLKIGKDGETGVNIHINPTLRSDKDDDGLYTVPFTEDTEVGVTNTEVGLFADGTEGAGLTDMLMFIPVLPAGYTYAGAAALAVNLEIDYDVVTQSANVDGGQVKVNNVIRKRIQLPKYRNGRIYKLKLILGVSSVQFEAEAADWTTDEQDIDLPRNLD